MFYVYWYHLDSHTNPHTEGYVGVTKHQDVRHRCHKNGLRGGSVVLRKAFIKYGDDAIKKQILHSVSTQEEAYALELSYRPIARTGWNLAVGGGLPPDTTGRKDSPEVCAKRAASVRRTKATRKYPSIFKGMTDRHDAARRKAIGDFHRGKTISAAHKQAITKKITGGNSPKAKEILLVHKDRPTELLRFACVRVAATELEQNYNTLRTQATRVFKSCVSSEPSRTGWIILTPDDAKDTTNAVRNSLERRSVQFTEIAKARGLRKKLSKGTGVTSGINI